MDLEEALAQADVYAEETEVCTIDNDLRTITIPSGLQTVGVESDEDVRRLNFQMPKQYHEIDLSEFNIRINFMNANNSGDVYAVTDKAVSGDNITFSWLVGRNALAYRGNIRFIVCLKKTDAEGVVQQEFNTTVATLSVLEGLETTEQVIQENPDIIEQILARLDELEENGGGGGTPGKDGVGISNIAKTGTAGLVDTYTITMTDETSYTFTVKNGENGNPGQDGTTPTIGENGNWYLGETDTGKPSRGETPNIKIGTVQTLDPGNQATASMSGTPENPLLNLGIPKGGQGPAGDSGIVSRQEMTSSDTTVTLQPNILYVFPEMSSLTITLGTPADSNVANEYHFFFTSGATATTLTLNDVMSDAYSIEANTKYEVSILENVAYIKGGSCG